MIRFLIILIVYCVASAIADWAIIESYRYHILDIVMKYKNLWHGLQAGIDLFLFVAILYILKKEVIKIMNWQDWAGILIMAAFIRDFSRTLITGIGTTSWIDTHIGYYGRLIAWGTMIFLSLVYVLTYSRRKRWYVEKEKSRQMNGLNMYSG